MNGDMNDNHCVDVGEGQDDYISVQRVCLTPVKNRDPRLRSTQSTPRRNWNGEDEKTRDPGIALCRQFIKKLKYSGFLLST